MALALVDCIASVGWNLDDQARRYVDWWQKGKYSVNGRCFDIGVTTRGSLGRFLEFGNAGKMSGLADERSSGNGSIMQLAPVPIHYSHLFPDDLETLPALA